MKLFYFYRKTAAASAKRACLSSGILEAEDEHDAIAVLSRAMATQGWSDPVSDYGFMDINALPKQTLGVLCVGILSFL